MNDLFDGPVDDDDDGLPPHLRRLLSEGAEGPAMSGPARDRVLGRVLATVAVTSTAATAAAAATTTAAPAATSAATAAAATGVGVKAVVVGLVVAGIVGVSVVVAVPRSSALPTAEPQPPLVVSLPEPPPTTLPAMADTATPEETTAPTSSTSSTLSAPVSTSTPTPPLKKTTTTTSAVPPGAPSVNASTTTTTVATTTAPWELSKLEAARAALARGDAAKTLLLVDEHAAAAPQSPLREEGAALRVLALAALERQDEAIAAASAFMARYPKSLFGPRVRRAASLH